MSRTLSARFQLDYGVFQFDVDINLPGTGISVLFGPSGSGKTTLLRCIAGLEHSKQGFLSVNGAVWQDSEQGLFVPAHKRSIGYVFQDANLFPHLNVAGNLRFGLKRVGKSANDPYALQILEILDIAHLLKRMPNRLSGGEQQRVAIARALVIKPDLLLMDEPLASLDVKLKQEIMPLLQQLHRELDIPVLYVTHAQQEVAQLADHLVLMGEGRVQAAGQLDEVLGRIDLPMAQEKQAVMVWSGHIAEHETEYHLTHVDFSGIELSLPSIDAPIGTPIRLQIYARDVSIALSPPKDTSILNVLPARIINLGDDHGSGQTVVCLQVGRQRLLAHITQKSRQLLDLQKGMPAYVQIKGTSILN